jgi:tetratricopeptide (TPR) repeat protein
VALHCGKSHHISDALKLAEETISLPISYWHIDVLEDVFSWDFFPGCFNYRSYLDLVVKVLVAKNRNGENSVENSHQYMEMVKLILASIYYYLGHYSNSLANFKKSMELDPMFPIYKLKYAENLMETGRSQDSFEAGNLLAQLSGNSLVSREAFVLLKSLYDKNIFVPNNWQELESLFNKAYNGYSESNLEIDFLSPGLVTLNQSLANKNSFSIKKKLDLVKSKLLSVVVTGRNDDYMGNFKYRLTTCLNYLCRNLEHLRRLDDVEILITDWNSDVPLANVLTLSPEASRICKFVCVPPEIAARLQAPGEVFYPTCAMNTSLRRAKGEFVMMFDADSLMPYHSVRSLLDVLEGKQPVGLKLDQTFFYSSRHHLPLEVVQRELSLEQLDRYLLLNGPGFSKDEGWPGLGVCGAAQMMHRSLWQECRGYNQDFRIQGWLDAELTLRVTQHYAWVDLLSLGVVLFHMEHWADNRQGKENLQKHNPHDISSSLAVNDESWGLGDYELEIKRVSGFVDYQTTGFHN